jgi:serine/threonine protein kinase
MTPERYRQIGELFHAALEVDAGERAAFLERACASDAELRREVESLINSNDQAADFIASPALAVAAELLADDADALTGQTIGRYHILSLLGAGGMGRVYLAEDTALSRRVALKLLPEHFTHDKNQVQRFRQEARATSALNHPNIVTIHEIGQTDSGNFIATEFIDGETLRKHMASTPMTVGDVLDVAAQVASALQAAHEAGIIHRDVKPENIMLRRDGIAKVLDFGLAKLALPQVAAEEFAHSMVNTNPGMVMGTVGYMSPEQVRGQEVDARTDIWSLGIVLYEMLTRRLPFAGETASDVIAAILKTEPDPLVNYSPEAPDELQHIAHKCVAKNREERYQTAKDLFADLRQLQKRLEVAAEIRRGAAPNTGAGGPGERIISSLAILPLVNASADAEVEYFSDGITESLINNLSQLRQLRVMAHSTVFRYKGQEIDPRQVGSELKVHAVLIGRVLQRGNRLNIRAELVDVRDGARLWGEHYDRSLADIFAVQEEIAREIYENLRLKLTGEEKQRLIKRPTENNLAYHAYLKGRYCWNKRTNEWLEKGMEHFQEAIELDSNYAAAYAGLSDSYTLLVIKEALPPSDGFSRAKAAATTALRIDESLAEAHASLAHAMLHNWEWTSAETEFKKAIEINPAYPSAHHWYSEYWEATGYLDKAIAEAKTAQELDPLSLITNVHLADLLYFARRYEESVEQAMKTLDFDQNFAPAHQTLARAYAEMGMYEEALSELQITLQLRQDSMECAWLMGHIYAVSGRTDEARDVLDQLIEQSMNRYVSPCGLAFIHVGLGETDQAFTWLEKAYEQHCGELFDLKVEPKYDSLRSDPRFRHLLERIGLE